MVKYLNDTYKMMMMMTMMMIRMMKSQNDHNSTNFEATTSIFCMLIDLNRGPCNGNVVDMWPIIQGGQTLF